MEKPKCLKQWQLLIKKQIPLNKNSFTRLIIHCSLERIRKEYGENGVNRVIERLDLKRLGFKLKDQS